MLFTSFAFFIFLPLVFAAYWLLGSPEGRPGVRFRLQNLLVVVASYVFYGWWDWTFLLLIFFTSIWAYGSGLSLARTDSSVCRKGVVVLALVVNLGILGVFKYYNFFVESFVGVLNMFGFVAHPNTLKLILPVGISFYTFQALSYVLDVYRGSVKPTRDPIAFLAFVSFFPQLVAGPIERASNLLPQFLAPRRFDYSLAVEGCRQILWGFVKKCLIADRFAAIANSVFAANVDSVGAGTLIVGALAFTVQIYGDFSGYSDIAIGCGKLFGIRLMRNFATPYFSRSIAEFWRRWHISLTTWFRDYVYIPLGGSRCSVARQVRNTFIVFLVSGLWHGANWTFVLWGAFHAVCFLPLLLCGKNRRYLEDDGRLLPRMNEIPGMALTFVAVVFGWMLFRAPDIVTFWHWVMRICSSEGWRQSWYGLPRTIGLRDALKLALVFFTWEWCARRAVCPLFIVPRSRLFRWGVYLALLTALFFYLPEVGEEFIYFQF